ncbi:MAG: PilZ domain-containing protein [Polyangiales bacterium]
MNGRPPGYAEPSRTEDEELAVDISVEIDHLDADRASALVDDADARVSSNPPPSLPLGRLVALLPDDGEHDERWGARRRGERIPFSKPIALSRSVAVNDSSEVKLDIETTFDGWSINVCHGGMRIMTEQPLQPGDNILVEVESSGSTYLGRARVCWVRGAPDGVIAGLEFLLSR